MRDEYRADYDEGRGGLGGGVARQYGRGGEPPKLQGGGAEPIDTTNTERVVSMQTS